jgi:hypothetical protein
MVDDLVVSPDYAVDGTVFTVAREKLFRSTDEGASLHEIVRGIEGDVTQLAVAPYAKQVMFAAISGRGVYRSIDQGWTWQRLTTPSALASSGDIAVSAKNSNVVFAAPTTTGLFRSNNGGATWVSIGAFGRLNALLYPDRSGRLLVGQDAGGVAVSDTNGASWASATGLPAGEAITRLGTTNVPDTGGPVFAGTRSGKLYRSTDRGTTFVPVGAGLPAEPVTGVAASSSYTSDGTVWVTTATSGAFRSTDRGATFVRKSTGLTTSVQAQEMGLPDFSGVVVAGRGSSKHALFVAGFDGTFMSNDGEQWRELQTHADQIVGVAVSPNYTQDRTVVATTYVKGAYVSTDRGTTWKDAHVGLGAPGGTSFAPIERLHNVVFSPDYARDGTIFTSTPDRLARSVDRAASWTTFRVGAHSDQTRYVIATSPAFATDHTVFLGAENGEVWRSTASGGPGTFSLMATIPGRIRSFAVSPRIATDATLFAGGGDGIYQSSDRGAHWTRVTTVKAAMLAISPNYGTDRTVFAASGASLWVTRNAGQSWAKLQGAPLNNAPFVEAVAVSPTYATDRNVFVSIRGVGLFKSSDGGVTFNATGTGLYNNNVLIADYEWPTSAPIQFSPAYATDHTMFGFAQSYVVRSTDSGATWTILDLPPATRMLEPPVVTRASATPVVTEGAAGQTRPLGITIVLSHPYAMPVTVQWNTNEFTGTGIASSGSDFVAKSGTLVFPVGATQQTATVTVLGDDVDEPNEALAITLHDATNAVVGGYQGLAVGTIVDDDG